MSFYTDFAAYYERIFPFRPRTFGFLDRAMGPQVSPLVDLGCSIGDYCGHFAADGRGIVGLDLDPGMIARARRTWPGVDFRCRSLCTIRDLGLRFAGAYSIGNVMTHIDRGAFTTLLVDLHDSLEPGAAWAFQIVNCDPILPLESYDFPPIDIGRGVAFHRAYREITPQGLRFLTRLEEGGQVLFSGEVSLYPLTTADYLRLHEDAGFRLRSHHRDFLGGAFEPQRFGGSVFVFERV